MPEKDIIVNIMIDSLKLKEMLEDIYIYKDYNNKKYSIFYNDEIKFPFNLEKALYKKIGKIKNFFEFIKDIEVQIMEKDDLIQILYIKNEKK